MNPGTTPAGPGNWKLDRQGPSIVVDSYQGQYPYYRLSTWVVPLSNGRFVGDATFQTVFCGRTLVSPVLRTRHHVQDGINHAHRGPGVVDGLCRPRPLACLDRHHHMGWRQLPFGLPDVSLAMNSSCRWPTLCARS